MQDTPQPAHPPSPAADATPPANADDLIAELAHEDLDRMLAAAEVDRNPSTHSAPAADSSPLLQHEPPAAEIPPSIIADSAAQVSDEVEQVLAAAEDMAELDSLPAHPESAAATNATPQAIPEQPAADPPAPIKAAVSPSHKESRLSSLLRPMDCLTWPLRAIPEPLVTALGYVGLVTLFNALAILLYVHRFRHK